MRIPQHLLQFKEERALLIVTGKNVAEFYIAADGVIEKDGSFEVTLPDYFKKEGFFGRRGGGLFSSGSIVEKTKQKVKNGFLKEFKDSIKELFSKNKINHIYIFSPSDTINVVEKNLPATEKKKVSAAFKGNFYKQNPLVLLEKINVEIKGKEVEMLKPEEAKILKTKTL